MKNIITLSLMLAASATASADAYEGFRLTQTDGTSSVLAAVGTKIVFSGGNLVATSGTETVTIPLTSMASMAFTETNTGISGVGAEETQASISVDGGSISVSAAANSRVLVVGIGGQIVGQYTLSAGETAVVASGLPGGVYIVRINSNSYKTLVR